MKSIVRFGAKLLKAKPIIDVKPPNIMVYRHPNRRINIVAIGPLRTSHFLNIGIV